MSTALTADDHRAILKEMAEVGMRLVRGLPQQVETSSPESLALAYTRLSRAVRLTLSLDRQFDVPAQTETRRVDIPMAMWERAGVSREDWQAETLRKNRTAETYDLVEHAIDSEYEGRERDQLTEALHERIDEHADEQRLLSTMPVAQIVTLICRDLGIRPNWGELEIDPEEFDPDERTLRALRLGKYEVPDLAAEAQAPAPDPPPDLIPEPLPPPEPAPAPHPFMTDEPPDPSNLPDPRPRPPPPDARPWMA